MQGTAKTLQAVLPSRYEQNRIRRTEQLNMAQPDTHVDFNPASCTIEWNEEEIEKWLNAKGEARQDSNRFRPSQEEETFGYLTRIMPLLFNSAHGAYVEVGRQVTNLLNQAKENINTFRTIENLKNKLNTDLETTCDRTLNKSGTIVQHAQTTELHFSDFREENDLLDRDADPKKPRTILIIIALTLFELVVNGWALGTAHQDGFIGALYEIFFYSAIIMGLGIAIGATLRQTNHVNRKRRIRAFVVMLLLFSLVLMIGFLMAHYRDALIGLLAVQSWDFQTYMDAITSLFSTAFNTAFSSEFIPKTMQSVLLFFAGLAIAILVAIEWYRMDDRYPGYGKITKSRDKANEDYIELVEVYKSQIIEFSIQARDEVEGLRVNNQNSSSFRKQIESYQLAFNSFINNTLLVFAEIQLNKYKAEWRLKRSWPSHYDQDITDKIQSFEEEQNKRDFNMPNEVREAELNVQKIDSELVSLEHYIEKASNAYRNDIFGPVTALPATSPDHDRFSDPQRNFEHVKKQLMELS